MPLKRVIVDGGTITWYNINEEGRCFNLRNNMWLEGGINRTNGYIQYNLTLPTGEVKTYYAHQLVAYAFLPEPEKGCDVIAHLDGDILNNNAENLRWVSGKEAEAIKKQEFYVYCFNKDKELVAIYRDAAEASQATGVPEQKILRYLNTYTKSLHYDFYWNHERQLKKYNEPTTCGRGKKVFQYTSEGKYLTSYDSIPIASKATRVSEPTIKSCCQRQSIPYNKEDFIWRYADDIVSPLLKSKEDE